MTELADKIDALAESLEAATRHCYGLPVIATESDTQPGRSALWCDNGMAGCGQVAVSVGEFPDKQVHAIAALANVAMALRPHLPTITRALRDAERMREAAAMAFAAIDDHNQRAMFRSIKIEEFHPMVKAGSKIACLSDARQALGDNT